MRADLYLFENGYADSRQNAKNLIEAGSVTLDGVKIIKPATVVDETKPHTVAVAETCPYVGRGGYKLEAAVKNFCIDVQGLDALDVGASTGGFTDCLLQNGACHVTALDVGEGQLAKKLRDDSRVTCMEHCNARYLSPEELGNRLFDLIVMDVSFISSTLIFPVFPALLKDNGLVVSLIKPQFEVGKSFLGKRGIVKDAGAHKTAVLKVLESAVSAGLVPVGLTTSPIEGGDGNREFLVLLKKEKTGSESIDESDVLRVIKDAHFICTKRR